MVQKMSRDGTQTGRVSTLALSILVALGVIALLACAEYAIPRWLHPGPGDSGSFFSSNSTAPVAAAPRPARSTRPESNSGSASFHNEARPAKRHIPASKPAADAGANSHASSADPQVSSESQASRSPEEARAAEENLRATEDATAHLVELEREERDRLFDRARAMKDRIEAIQKRQAAPREDLAFSEQRFQNDLSQADAALKAADVQKAKIYLDLAKGELEALAKLLGR